MLNEMGPEVFGETLLKLQDSVDDEFFGEFWRQLMPTMHKMAPKFKAEVHKIYGMPRAWA